MIRTMTVTELVRDTCQEATARTARGEQILVKRGGRPLFKIVPNRADDELPNLDALEADLQTLASESENNPVMKLRARRL
jgi:antitoxin (DNA-binding transcriptional repressor) of toxin-antitoxin stability system